MYGLRCSVVMAAAVVMSVTFSTAAFAQQTCYTLINTTNHQVVINYQYPPGLLGDHVYQQIFVPGASIMNCFDPGTSSLALIATPNTQWEGNRQMSMGTGGLPAGTYRMIQSPPPSGPNPTPTPATGCGDFGGNWQVETFNGGPASASPLSPMHIDQNVCNLSGGYQSAGPYSHTLSGRMVGDTASVTIMRTDPKGCTTPMYGTFSRLNNQQLNAKINSTGGGCGLPTTYQETRIWRHDCVYFDGTWQLQSYNGGPASVSPLSPMQINQKGCMLTGSYQSAGPYKHTMNGLTGVDTAAVSIIRTDPTNCTTTMQAQLSFGPNRELIFKVLGLMQVGPVSPGPICGLPIHYVETRTWKQ